MSFNEIQRSGAALLSGLKDGFIAYLPTLLAALAVFAAGMAANRLIMHILGRGLSKSPLDKSARAFFASVVKTLLYLIVFVTVLAVLGIPMTSLVAVIGSAGLALGLSMQSSLSNVAAGIILLAGKPFKTGDFIEAGGVSGSVEEMSVICVKLVAPDNTVIYLPNNAVSGSTVKNFSEMPARRLETVYRTDAAKDLREAVKLIGEAVGSHPRVLKSPPPAVRISAITMRTAEITARYWVESADFDEVRHDINLLVNDVL
jgi:small conductance mechanosensitive channel